MDALLELWRLLDHRQRRAFFALQGVAVLMAISTLGGVAALVPFLIALADPAQVAAHPLLASVYRALAPGNPHRFTLALGAGFVIVMLLSNLINLLGAAAMTRFAFAIGDEFQAALLDEYLRRDRRSHASSGAGALFNRVIYTVNRVATGLIDNGMLLIASALSVLIICASIVWVNPPVVVGALVWIGGAYLTSYVLARRKLAGNGALERDLFERRARIARETLRASKELRTSGRQGAFVARFADACRALSRVAIINHLIAQAPRYVLECATFGGLVAIALFVANGRAPTAWLAQLSFLALAAYRLLPAAQQLFASLVRIRASRALFEEILPDLDVALRHRRGAGPADTGQFDGRPIADIRLENVTVRFDDRTAPALDRISLAIQAGEMLGIIGANASGKTTLADVIAGLLAPDAGRVLVDGTEIDAGNRAEWCRTVAYVPQEVYLMESTIAENIAFGVPAGDLDSERARDAARLAGLDAGGLDAPVAEDGLLLSGGYRQRVAIARAFYQRKSLLILDEATSSLDSISEQELVGVLDRMRGRCTLIVIAHRKGMLRHCDRIVELDAGRVVAAGTFADLAGLSSLRVVKT
jgi:ABC-type multidrug transport system fused ATPase/permease subunit